MTTEFAHASHHLTDAELVRHIDDEGDAPEQERWQAHLGACDACAGELAKLRAQSRRVTEWLERADAELAAPGGRRIVGSGDITDDGRAVDGVDGVKGGRFAGGGRFADVGDGRRFVGGTGEGARRRHLRAAPLWLRIAASLVLVAAPLAAITPVREWIGEHVGLIRSDDAPALTATHERVGEEQTTVLRFVPTAGRFTVVLDTPQTGGTLRIERATGPEALLESGTSQPAAFVSAGLLRIGNEEASATSYTLALPASIGALDVVIGGHTIRLDRAELDSGSAIPLDGSAGRTR